MYALKAMGRGPVVEKRGRRFVYRRAALDAFLLENGSDPIVWAQGWSRDVVDQLRVTLGYRDPELEAFVEVPDDGDDDWDPEAAK